MSMSASCPPSGTPVPPRDQSSRVSGLTRATAVADVLRQRESFNLAFLPQASLSKVFPTSVGRAAACTARLKAESKTLALCSLLFALCSLLFALCTACLRAQLSQGCGAHGRACRAWVRSRRCSRLERGRPCILALPWLLLAASSPGPGSIAHTCACTSSTWFCACNDRRGGLHPSRNERVLSARDTGQTQPNLACAPCRMAQTHCAGMAAVPSLVCVSPQRTCGHAQTHVRGSLRRREGKVVPSR